MKSLMKNKLLVPMDIQSKIITEAMTCLLSKTITSIKSDKLKTKEEIYQEIILSNPKMKSNPFFYGLYSSEYDRKSKLKA